MKKRIYIDGRVLIPRNKSGVGLYVANIIKSLDDVLERPESTEKHLDVKILIPHRAKKMVEKELKLRTIRFRSIPLPFRGMNLLSRLNLLPPLDLFYGRGTYIFPSFVKERLLNSKAIVFFYDFAFKHFPESLNQKQRTLLEKNYESSLQSDGIVTISDGVANEIINERRAKKGVIIAPPAVDTRQFYRRSIDEIIITKNHFRISGAYILFVGNIEPRKNLKTLIDAYISLPADIQARYTLVIAGAGSWASDETLTYIKSSVREGFKIKLLIGSVDEKRLPSLYSGASALAFPSIYEGYGMPILESMACGVPVITGSSKEILEAAGGASYQVSDITDKEQLAKALEVVLTDPAQRNTLIEKGYERVSISQEWTKSAEELYQLIISLNAKNGAR